ncbi:MAG: S41 family peptidase [Chloroflexota bacterium]
MRTTSWTVPLIILFAIVGFNGGYVLAQSPFAPVTLFGAPTTTPAAAQETFEPFWETWDLVHRRFFDQEVVDDQLLMEGAIEGMLAVLEDQNTRYLPPQDEAAAREQMSGEFQGIGAEIVLEEDGAIVVVSPIDGSPAEAAGLQPGDILRKSDGVELTGMDASEAAQLVRGPAGTAVLLTIERDGETFDVEIIRDVIKLASVRGEIIEDNLAYIRLSRFAESTTEELEATLQELVAQNPAGIILDVRRNPGGLLQTSVDVADQFLPAGTVVVERFGDGRERVFEATDEGLAEDIPLVVLIDEGSASASEVLAGAVRDYDRGVLIGQTSFGKGTAQTWHPLSNGGGVRITIARWLTPTDEWVHETGITPDFFIPLPELTEEGDFVDTQLEAARDFLLGETVISVPPSDG